MGHLNIVNQETLRHLFKEGCISVRGKLGKYMVKTTADLFSDILTAREGDYVFPWIIRSAKSGNEGFRYRFEVSGPPFFVQGDDYPLKIPLNSAYWEYEEALSEAEALDLWDGRLLWNVIGKKSLGRGRSFSHQTPWEDERLMELLGEKNPGGPEEKELKPSVKTPSGKAISINPRQSCWDSKLESDLEKLPPEDRLKNLQLDGIPWSKGALFKNEKCLEAWIMQTVGRDAGREWMELMLPSGADEPVWFGNYLPFGVQGGNMDVVVIQGEGESMVVTVIELKVGSLTTGEYRDAVKEVTGYQEFLKSFLESFEIGHGKVKRVILSGKRMKGKPQKWDSSYREVDWYEYWIDDGEVRFTHTLRYDS